MPESYGLLTDANTTGDCVVGVKGGGYLWSLVGAFGGATATLQALAPDATSWQDIADATTAELQGVLIGQDASVRVSLEGGAPEGLFSSLAGCVTAFPTWPLAAGQGGAPKLPPLELSATAFLQGASAGTVIATIHKTQGAALSLSPNDGRIVFDTEQRALLVGGTASPPGAATYAIQSSLTLEVGGTISREDAFEIECVAVVGPPIFLSTSAVGAPEGAPYAHQLATDQVSTFEIVGGADSALGSIVGDELTLAAQTYAGGGDNTRDIEVRATATATGLTADQTITFTVEDVAPPVNIVAPSISGDSIEGAILTATPGTWIGATSVTGQWYRGSSPISGETNLTYRLSEADIGAAMKYSETAANSGGSTDQDSNVTSAVLNGIVARIAFRETPHFVTDDPRWTYCTSADTALTNRGGYEFQYVTGMTFSNTVGWSGVKPLSGQATASGSSGRVAVKVPPNVDLNVRLAFGSPQGTVNVTGQIQNGDGGPAIVTYPSVSQGPGQVVGADGALIDYFDWVGFSEALSVTAAENTAGSMVFRKGPNTGFFPLRAIEITHPQFSQVTAGVGPFYVDAVDGDDVTGDGTEAHPWQHIPGDPSAGGLVRAFNVLPGGEVLLKRGQRHRPASYAGRDSTHLKFRRPGESGNPIIFGAYGTGDPPLLDGSEVIGSWSTPTSGEVSNNPNVTNLRKAAISGVAAFHQMLCEGDTYLAPAQWPSPSDPKAFERIYTGTDAFISVPVADYAGKVTLGEENSGGGGFRQCTILSDIGLNNLKDHYGVHSVDLTGYRVCVLRPPSFTTECEITAYSPTTGLLTFNLPNAQTLHVSSPGGGLFRFCVRYHPYDLLKPGQSAWASNALTTAIIYPYGAAERSIVRLEYGIDFNQNHIEVEDIGVTRFGINSGGASKATAIGGVAPVGIAFRRSVQSQLNNLPDRNAANRPGIAVAFAYEDITITDTPRVGGFQFGSNGVTVDGAYHRHSGRTSGYFSGVNGVFENFDFSDNDSVHGNGASVYQDSFNVELRQFYVANHPLPVTVQKTTPGLDRQNKFKNFFVSGKQIYPGETLGISIFSLTIEKGEKNSLIEGGVAAITPTLLGASTVGGEPLTGTVIRNCVLTVAAYSLTGVTFENVYIMNDGGQGSQDLMAKGAEAASFGIVYAPSGSNTWDGTITEGMQKALTKNGTANTYTARTIGPLRGPAENPWHIPAWGEAHSLGNCSVTTREVNAGHRALLAFASVVNTKPMVTIGLPAGQGDNDLFGMSKGQVHWLSPPTAGTYELHIEQVSVHPDLTGSASHVTVIPIIVK